MASNFLFWNTKKNKEINRFLEPLIVEKGCNFVVLAEYVDSIECLCNELAIGGHQFRWHTVLGCDRIVIIENCCDVFESTQGSSYYAICHVMISGQDYLVSGVHLPSKMHAGDDEQENMARRFAQDIQAAEDRYDCQNTVIIGDFNANPFEKALIGADCLHAVSDRGVAQELERTVYGMKYRMLYNPMWNLLGDVHPSGGSYFYRSSDVVNYFWHIFDQVLLHPKLLGQFDHKSLEIVTEIESECLLKKDGRPNDKISDHLPIYFSMKERESNGE